MLDRGQVDGVIRVLPGFARDVGAGRTTSVQVLLDGTNSNTASMVSGYAEPDDRAYSSERDERRAAHQTGGGNDGSQRRADSAGGSAGQRRRRACGSIPILRSRNYFIPGVIVNIITLVTLSLTAMAIVREKEIGTMEQLMVTPIRPVELILGKTLPFVVVGLLGHAAGGGGGAADFSRSVSRQLSGLLLCAARSCSC